MRKKASINKLRLRLVDRLRNTNALGLLEEFIQTQWLSSDEIHEIQWQRINNLLGHAYNNVPYYRQIFDAHGLKPKNIKSIQEFKKIPVLTKDTIRKTGDDMLARNMKTFGPDKRATGGSTGAPLHFYADQKSRSAQWANMYRQWTIAGWEIGERLVYLGGSSLYPSLHAFGKWLYFKLNNWLLFSAFDMSQESMKKWVKKIRRFRPRFMHAYASSAYLFAEFLEREHINDISFKAVSTSAEPLYPHYRDKIERVFSAESFDLYGAVDGGGFAFECNEHKGLHCAFENSYLEVLKEDGMAAGPGEAGEIVSTDLFNYAMPFIRYKVGDIATVASSPCTCGRSSFLLEKIKGRSHDFVTTQEGTKVHGEYFSHLFRKIDWISQFYVVQESETELKIHLKPESQPSADKISWVRNILKGKFPGMKISVIITRFMPQASSGKFKFIINKTLEKP